MLPSKIVDPVRPPHLSLFLSLLTGQQAFVAVSLSFESGLDRGELHTKLHAAYKQETLSQQAFAFVANADAHAYKLHLQSLSIWIVNLPYYFNRIHFSR